MGGHKEDPEVQVPFASFLLVLCGIGKEQDLTSDRPILES